MFCKSEAFGELRRLTTGVDLFTRSSAFESRTMPSSKQKAHRLVCLRWSTSSRLWQKFIFARVGRIYNKSLVAFAALRPKNSHLGSFCLSYRHRHGLSNLNSFPPKQKAHLSVCFVLAEKERFELSNPFTGYTISNRARSTSYATSPCLSLTELFYHNDL